MLLVSKALTTGVILRLGYTNVFEINRISFSGYMMLKLDQFQNRVPFRNLKDLFGSDF